MGKVTVTPLPMKSAILSASVCLIYSLVTASAVSRANDGPHMANGIKIGEVDQTSAIVWVRLTQNESYRLDGREWEKDDEALPPGLTIGDMQYSAAGSEGEVRISYWAAGGSGKVESSRWSPVNAKKNFSGKFQLKGLSPGTDYTLKVEGRSTGGSENSIEVMGGFKTAAKKDEKAPVKFVLATCHDFPRRDDLINGHYIYPAMLDRVDPDFLVHAGDIEYYDKPLPWAKTETLAYYKWDRLFGLPNFREFYRQVPAYFMKDDHDLLKNDSVPGDTYGELTWDRGIEIFNETFPMGERPYRTVRWGKDLQIWMMESREYRSPNSSPDGPSKTIWGEEQKKWFFDTFAASDATFRIVINPNPIVGPDRENKKDNHANSNFTYEGNELRSFIGSQKNAFILNGDRHWQYVSVDEKTGAREYSCGAGTDIHAGGFRQSLRSAKHRFLRIKGGFLSVTVERESGRPRISLRHHDVHGDVVNEDIFFGED